MLRLILVSAITILSTSCVGAIGKFYVYDTPEWREIATLMLHRRHPTERMERAVNGGAGPEVDAAHGVYHTDQYQLFQLVYYRALKDHSRRTMNPAEASTFVIPYDLGSDCVYFKGCPRDANSTCMDTFKCPTSHSVEKLLLESPWFHRNYGHDHLAVVGLNYGMNNYLGKPKCRAFLAGVCTNCTKWAIDDYSYFHTSDRGILFQGDYWHSAPFPANFHFNMDMLTHMTTTNSLGGDKEKPGADGSTAELSDYHYNSSHALLPWNYPHRSVLVSYTGSIMSHNRPAAKLRTILANRCEQHETKNVTLPVDNGITSYSVIASCTLQSYGRKGTRGNDLVTATPIPTAAPTTLNSSSFALDELAQEHSHAASTTTIAAESPHHPNELSKQSIFCFQPTGDLPTRKGLFDSIVMGCIPVVFHSQTAENMYTWHWSEEFWKKVIVKFDMDKVIAKVVDPISVLQDMVVYHSDEVHEKQRLLRDHVFELQYGLPLSRKAQTNNVGVPRDAYDILIDHTLSFHDHTAPDVRVGTVTQCWDGVLDEKLNKCVGYKGKLLPKILLDSLFNASVVPVPQIPL